MYRRRVRLLEQRPRVTGQELAWLRPWSGPAVFALGDLWFPEVVGRRRSRAEVLKALGFPQESQGPQHPLLPAQAHPLGHVAFQTLPRSSQLPSPALEGF